MNKAIIFGLLSAFFAALTTILAKIGLKQLDSTVATAIRAVIMAIFLLLVILIQKRSFDNIISDPKVMTFVILSGICGALSWLFYFQGLASSNATLIAAMDKLSIVFIFILSILFLSEKFEVTHLLGVFMIAAGAILMIF